MSRSHGFSMVELMIALVIAGIILAIGMPAFGNYRNSMMLRQVHAQLLQDIRRARQLAVTRRAPVVIRFGTPPTITNITSYSIHVDTNADNIVQGSETRTVRQLPSGTKLNSVNMASQVDTLTFDISGTLKINTLGGTLVFSNLKNKRDTLAVSAAGICYRP
jgi:prepilin-type N-terminal cleavage/methylation domain-containing protein